MSKLIGNFLPGDFVKYFPTKGIYEFRVRRVRGIYPNGMPSFPKPMVMLEGESGLIDAAHCELTPAPTTSEAED